jgi:hypothetical protein
MKTILSEIAQCLQTLETIPPTHQAVDAWERKLAKLRDLLPSGSGFDAGTEIVSGNNKKVTLSTSYHHMNENGYYDGWTGHEIILTPSFNGYDMRITGKDRNGIKDYIGDVFTHCLDEECCIPLDL